MYLQHIPSAFDGVEPLKCCVTFSSSWYDTLGGVEVARAPGVNRRRSAHKTATHISVDLVIVLFRVDVTCHTSRVTVTRHNVCCI